MSFEKIVALPKFAIGICPYCQKRLRKVEVLKRKKFRCFKCKNCRRMIDERMICRQH